jgi:hypothetical protein
MKFEIVGRLSQKLQSYLKNTYTVRSSEIWTALSCLRNYVLEANTHDQYTWSAVYFKSGIHYNVLSGNYPKHIVYMRFYLWKMQWQWLSCPLIGITDNFNYLFNFPCDNVIHLINFDQLAPSLYWQRIIISYLSVTDTLQIYLLSICLEIIYFLYEKPTGIVYFMWTICCY